MISRLALSALTFVFLAIGFSADAAEPVFPGISRLGLIPPAGMQVSSKFSGFEQRNTDAVILLNELPKEAYDELGRQLSEQLLQAQGLQLVFRGKLDGLKTDNLLIVTDQKVPGASVRRYMLVSKSDDFTGLVTVQLPGNAQKAFNNNDIRKALATYVVRAPLSPEEQLKGLPFTIGETNGFRLVRTFAGNAAMLTDGPIDNVQSGAQPTIVAAATFTPIPLAEREVFNKRALNSLPQLKEIRLEGDETKGSGDDQTSELIGSGRLATTGELMLVFQFLRYNKDGYLRLVGQGNLNDREALLERFRKMALSLRLK